MKKKANKLLSRQTFVLASQDCIGQFRRTACVCVFAFAERINTVFFIIIRINGCKKELTFVIAYLNSIGLLGFSTSIFCVIAA